MLKLLFALAFCLTFPIKQNPGQFKNLCRMKMTHTPIGQVELAAVLRDGHYKVFGHFPSENRLAVAWAQVALENGQGYRTYNYNLGKINAWPKQPHYVQRHRFYALRDFQEGGAHYWGVISRMCSSALPAFDRGVPEWAANTLSGCGYFGADKVKYGKAMRKLYRKAKRQIIPKL